MMRPDYAGGSIVNLMASLGHALGADAGGYAPLLSLPPAALEGARNLVLLVLDGMGSAFLERAGGGSVLAAHRRGVMTSVFPPTTATAITAFMTGVAPQQHGLTGWFTWLRETASVVAVLPFQARHGGASLRVAGVDPARVFTARPFVDMVPVKCFGVCPKEIARSDFNTHHAGGSEVHPYDGLGGLFPGIGGPPEAPPPDRCRARRDRCAQPLGRICYRGPAGQTPIAVQQEENHGPGSGRERQEKHPEVHRQRGSRGHRRGDPRCSPLVALLGEHAALGVLRADGETPGGIQGIQQANAGGGAALLADVPMPEAWPAALQARYGELGKGMLDMLGINRADKDARNQLYAHMADLFGAPCLVVACIRRESLVEYAMLDAGLVVQTICLLDHGKGLGTCIMAAAVRYPDRLRKIAFIPDDRRIVVAIALGQPDWTIPSTASKESGRIGAIYLGDDRILHHVMGRLSGRDVYGGYWKSIAVLWLRHERLA